MRVKILHGEIHSGKTTYLEKFCKENSAAGILSPKIDGLRYFKDISSAEICMLEASENETEIFSIGRFRFSKSAFQWAEEKIKNAIISQPDYLIIDEIGPLELKGEGFAEILNDVIENKNSEINALLLVIRNRAVEEVMKKFGMKRFDVEMKDVK